MADDKALDLTQIPDLVAALESRDYAGHESHYEIGEFDGTFCPSCGETRRVALFSLHWEIGSKPDEQGELRFTFDSDEATPALFRAKCLQCHEGITIVVSCGPHGPELVALPSTYGGLSTPNTPSPVAFYLDQAQRCQSVGALSATVAMYRAALEQLLYEQGYKSGMLKKKIEDLIADTNAPPWRDQLDPAFLEAMKDLGNAAIHPNDGDISKQAALHAGLLREVRALFEELLEEAYEVERRRADRLKALKEGVAATKK